VIGTLCGWADRLIWQRVSCFWRDSDGEAPASRLLDPESRRRRVFFARLPYRFCLCFCLCFCFCFLFLLLSLLLSFAFLRTAAFGPPTARAALEHMSVMEQAVEHGGDRGAVAQQLAPVFYWPI